MIRKIKALGIAAVGVLAMSAVVASAANANSFTAASYPVTINGNQEGAHTFTYDGRVVTCETAKFAGMLAAKSTALTVTPTYEKCHANILGSLKSATIDLNGCDYLATSTPSAELHLGCPAGQDTKITVFNEPVAGATHQAAKLLCTYTIKAQSANAVVYHNVSPKIRVTTLVNFGATKIGSILTCGKESSEVKEVGTTLYEGSGGVAIDLGP